MGTSGSFGGSGGKDARDLRDNIAEWLDGSGLPGAINDADADPSNSGESSSSTLPAPGVGIDLGPALRLLLRPRGGGGGDGLGSGSGGGMGGGGGRSSGGATRSVGRVSRAVGRAGRLAMAYSTANREVLRQAGLNYDELRSLGDPIAIGIKIVEAAFSAPADSTIADAEERYIVADVVAWILEQPDGQPPTPEEVVRKSIEMTIVETALTEVSSTVYAKDVSYEKRHSVEQQIRDVAAEYAAQASLSPVGATEQEMAKAIETGIRDIGMIFGVRG